MSMLDSLSKLGLPEARLNTRIHWYNGNQAARTPGIFYLKGGPFVATPGAPWKKSERYEHKGEVGYETTKLRMALIAKRLRPFITNDKGDVEYINEWKKDIKAQFKNEYLCIAEGISGPTVFISDGMIGREVSNIVTDFMNNTLYTAKQMTGLEVPPWSLWFTLSSQRGPDGRLAYEPTGHGNATVTLPALDPLPQPLTLPDLERLYTGEDIVNYGFEIEAMYDYFEPLRSWLYPFTPSQAPARTAPALAQPAPTERMIDMDLFNAIRDLQRELKLSEARIIETLHTDYGVQFLKELTQAQGDELYKRLKKARDERIAAANANKAKQGGNYVRGN